MLTLAEIFAIIIIHWIADFIFQDEKWALGKSKNWKDLLDHTIMYSYIWYIIGLFLVVINLFFPFFIYKPFSLSLFPLITLIAHTITDYFTSKIVSKRFKDNHLGSAIPNLGAFTIIGFDQVLHYIQLFTTYYLLK
jgi:hypothetical protein